MSSTMSPTGPNPKGAQTVITSIVFTALASFALALRLATRLGIVRNVGSDDWLILVSWMFSVILTVLVCIGE